MKIINPLFLIPLTVFGFGLACGSFERLNSFAMPDGQAQSRDLETVEGKVFESPDTQWQLIGSSMGKNKKIAAFYFLDEQLGWMCNEKYIFHTVDGGETWTSIPINFVGTAKINLIRFTDARHGWLILQENDASVFSFDDQLRIYRTLDGGATWSLSHVEKPALFVDAYFSGDFGWVIATRFVGFRPQRLAPLVINFSKEALKWTDVTGEVKELSSDPWYAEGSFPQLGGVAVSLEKKCVFVVNQSTKIFESCDEGKIWKLSTLIGKTHPLESYSMKKIGVNGGFKWTLQSTEGIEGVSTLLTIIPDAAKEKSKVLSVPGYFSTHAYSVSDKEFFLVGQNGNTAFLLHTKDSGATWNKIFSFEEQIADVQFRQSNCFWVLNNSGDLIKVGKTP